MSVVVRALGLFVLAAVVGFGTSLLSDPDGGASIGAGLFALLAVVVAAFVWGWRDGRRDQIGRVLVRWALTGLLVGLAVAVLPQVGSEEFFSPSTYLEDLPFSGTYGFVLTVVAAGFGALIGALRRGRPASEHEDGAAADGTAAG